MPHDFGTFDGSVEALQTTYSHWRNGTLVLVDNPLCYDWDYVCRSFNAHQSLTNVLSGLPKAGFNYVWGSIQEHPYISTGIGFATVSLIAYRRGWFPSFSKSKSKQNTETEIKSNEVKNDKKADEQLTKPPKETTASTDNTSSQTTAKKKAKEETKKIPTETVGSASESESESKSESETDTKELPVTQKKEMKQKQEPQSSSKQQALKERSLHRVFARKRR